MDRPHLTPSELFRSCSLPDRWSGAKIGFICFTPFPAGFSPYVRSIPEERYFLHSPPSEVRLCEYGSIPFVVLSEVYGFAVGTTTVEELIHYGMDTVIGLGFVGAFNGAKTGEKFIADSVLADLPIGRHYGVEEMERIGPSRNLDDYVDRTLKGLGRSWPRFGVWNSNSLYREYPETVDRMKEAGCQVVNMDTLSLFAAGEICRRESGRPIEYGYYGSVTDSSGTEAESWDSDLMETIAGEKAGSHDEMVRIIVEDLLPGWVKGRTSASL